MPWRRCGLRRELQRLFVDERAEHAAFRGPHWGVFNTKRFSGFPSRLSPYASAAPGGADSDNLQVLVAVKPR